MNNYTRNSQKPEFPIQLVQAPRNNDHTLIAMSAEEFVNFAMQQKQNNGMSQEAIVAWIDGTI
ncbi:MAG: hypothetical protein ACI93R_001013 [Flavobacteriales bacterium]|jgi:hypothetical protein